MPSSISWPAWPIQDALRRSPAVDLQPAITRYAAALVRNPEDATAHRRLGQIALSRGVVAEALAHLETAYRLAPDHRATRLLLGEAYVLSGQIDQAAELYRTVNNPTDSVIQGRRWWISQVGTEEQQAWFDEASKRGLP